MSQCARPIFLSTANYATAIGNITVKMLGALLLLSRSPRNAGGGGWREGQWKVSYLEVVQGVDIVGCLGLQDDYGTNTGVIRAHFLPPL
jgi:hypothetical protein